MSERLLIYTSIARGNLVLCEHTAQGIIGNFPLVALKILEKMGQSPQDTRTSFTQDSHLYSVLVSGGVTYLTMSSEALGRRVPFAFLEDIKTRFTSRYTQDVIMAASAYELNPEMEPILEMRMQYFSKSPNADLIGKVQEDLRDVRSVMVDNIQKVLERGERIELLVDRTDRLADDSQLFQRGAVRLRRTAQLQKLRFWGAVGGGAAVLLYFVLAISCGPFVNHC